MTMEWSHFCDFYFCRFMTNPRQLYLFSRIWKIHQIDLLLMCCKQNEEVFSCSNDLPNFLKNLKSLKYAHNVFVIPNFLLQLISHEKNWKHPIFLEAPIVSHSVNKVKAGSLYVCLSSYLSVSLSVHLSLFLSLRLFLSVCLT